MTEFSRKHRYIVIKLSDMPKASLGVQAHFNAGYRALREDMYSSGVKDREYLVIESDWPEYEPTWRAIEARVAGAAQKVEDDYFTCSKHGPTNEGVCGQCESAAQKVAALGLPRRRAVSTAALDQAACANSWNACLDAVEPLVAGLRAEVERFRLAGVIASQISMSGQQSTNIKMQELLRDNAVLRTRNAELVGLLRDMAANPHTFISFYLSRIKAALSAYEGREDG